ncbi:chromosome partitioning protein ParA [Halorarum halophilum]|uniref:Chromosome partitioning protein ParA n=1 Tax=Halorarum halophilum TaxID=2743090 RepID=A0A7D5GM69_9EURY|nr:chromosome partitioning protein ParA [Halobaculum halophilum]QLG28547.1 chromosome partitioning protein ParA [Halobaculum halophilum]
MILAVTGGKGGVGKSTLAYNLGAALDAVVVDADLAMADLPWGRGPDLHDVLAGRADPAEALRPGPVDLLPCGRSLAGARAADVGRLEGVVRSPGRDVLVDCPAGLRADAGVPLAVADACIVVASPRAWALADAVRARGLARELDAGLVAVALNRLLNDPPTAAVERTLGAPVVSVPADPRLGRSVGAEEPVVDTSPDSAGARAVEALAAEVQSCKSP